MPTLFFYAAESDYRLLLDLVFMPRLGFRVFEMQSQVNEGVRELASADDALAASGSAAPHLALLAPNAGASPTFTQIYLRGPSYQQGDFDFRCEGWGLIRLQAGPLQRDRIWRSATGHYSEKRCHSWSETNDRMGSPSAWNWNAVTSSSRALNHQIRRAAPIKLGSRPVLPGALLASQQGLTLNPT